MEEKNEKKEISSKTAVKGLINGVVSYGLIMLFIFFFIVIVMFLIFNNNNKIINHEFLKFSIPLIISIFVFFVIRATCHLSTFDLFKKCKIKENDIENVSNKMNFFYLCCVGFSAIVILSYLLTRFGNEQKIIRMESNENFKKYPSEYAEYLENEKIEEFQNKRADVLMEVLIVEAGLIVGIFSLIPTQKKLILKYNE